MWSEVAKYLFAVFMILAGPAAGAGLKSQLELMAEEHGFQLSGEAALTGASAVQARAGDIGARINRMLADFNHVVIRSAEGSIARVMILGPIQPAPPAPDRIVVNTRRLGSHHTLTVTLVGADGSAVNRQLIVDTGSTFVVLPRSLIDPLGIDHAALSTRELQTVAGRVMAQVGNLYALRIGGRELREIAVAFIPDANLGENLLLGMSALNRFQVTLDDQQNRLILILRN